MIPLEKENKEDNVVKIFTKSGSGRYLVSKTTTQIFRSRMKISRFGERCFIDFGTPEGGVELELPKEFGKNLVETMMSMLEPEEVKEILRNAEERIG